MASYVWDQLSPHLLSLYEDSWAKPFSDMSARTEVAVIFSKRVQHRVLALNLLFNAGVYDQAVPLVRAAYEDWLQAGYILVATGPSDHSRAVKYRGDVAKTEAQLYKSFGALAGGEARDREMADPPEDVLELSGRKSGELRVSGHWAQKADSLDLRLVHDFVHPYLSELSHGSIRNYHYLFVNNADASEMAPVQLERHEDSEQMLALWAWWFQLRTLTICALERGLDFSGASTQMLEQLTSQGKNLTLNTACFVIESGTRRAAPGARG